MHYPTIHDLNRARRLKAQHQKKYRQTTKTRIQMVDSQTNEKEHVKSVVRAYRASNTLDVYGECVAYDAEARMIKIDLMSTRNIEELKLDAEERTCDVVVFYHVRPYEDSLQLMRTILQHRVMVGVHIIICDFNGYYANEEEARRDLPPWANGPLVVCLPANPHGEMESLFSFRL